MMKLKKEHNVFKIFSIKQDQEINLKNTNKKQKTN